MVTAKKVAPAHAEAAPEKKAAAKSAVPAVKAPAVKKAAVAKPKVPKVAKDNTSQPTVTDEQRARYVEVAAFYIAERRGFAQGNPTDDWLAAEAEVDRLIATGQFPVSM